MTSLGVCQPRRAPIPILHRSEGGVSSADPFFFWMHGTMTDFYVAGDSLLSLIWANEETQSMKGQRALSRRVTT